MRELKLMDPAERRRRAVRYLAQAKESLARFGVVVPEAKPKRQPSLAAQFRTAGEHFRAAANVAAQPLKRG